MLAPFLPPGVSGNVAAALLGVSPRRIRRLIDDGLLPVSEGKVTLAGIEAHAEREISAEAYLAAKSRVNHVYLRQVGSPRQESCPNDRAVAF